MVDGIYSAEETYNPIAVGSIDGTDVVPHDHAIVRATHAHYEPERDPHIKGHPRYTLFIGRLSYDTTEETIKSLFSQYGTLLRIRLVRDIITGASRGYCFVEYKHSTDAKQAYQRMNNYTLDGRKILVDIERERLMKSWVPRRLGGGFGGKKESGQLRFGGRARPHRKPLKISKNEIKSWQRGKKKS